MSLDLWSEIKKIWREIDILKSFDVPSASIITGWQNDIDTWTYASAATLTITGDVTARFPVGTKIKLTQTTVKYFYVVSAVYSSPNTTLTLTAGNVHSLVNAAITYPYYSYHENPQGFPGAFAYTPAFTGFSANPTPVTYFKLSGKLCFVSFLMTNGTSNSTTFTMSLPIAAANLNQYFVCNVVDNGADQAAGNGHINLATGLVDFYKSAYSAFTNSGNKRAQGQFHYWIP